MRTERVEAGRLPRLWRRGGEARVARSGLLVGLLLGALAGCSKGRDRLMEVDGLPSAERRIDFGAISVGTQSTHQISLLDSGRAPVQIARVELRSGGQIFNAQTQARVAPGSGGRATIDVTFHPETEGDFGDELVIYTSSNDTPELHVQLVGTSGPAALVFDPPLLDWGGVETGDERTIGFDVINPTDLPLTLDSDAVGNEFELSAFTAPPNSRTHLTATFRAGVLGERKLNVRAKPCAACTAVGLPGRGEALESAVAMNPNPLTWDGVPVHFTSDGQAMLKNRSWRDITVKTLQIDGRDFEVVAGPQGATIPAGQSAPVTIRYLPQHLGETQRQLAVGYHSFADRQGSGKLVGMGGGPQIAVTPRTISFADLPVGGKQRIPLYVQNAGQYKDLTITSVSGAAAPFSVTLPANASIAPGAAALAIPVDFAPTAEGRFSAEIHIRSNDPATPDVAVSLSGAAHPAGPCVFKLTPEKLDFGNVPPGLGAVLGFRFEDSGTTECAVKDIQLDPSSDPAFFMPGGALVGGDLNPTDAFSAQVAFRSPGAGEFHGTLVMTVNNPSQPVARIPIVAHSAESCLVAAPPFIDFGAVRFDCSAHLGRTVVLNQCDHPVTVDGVALGASTLPEFSIVDAPSGTPTLNPGDSFPITAQYARSTLGQQYGAMYITAQGEPVPLLVPLLAETLHEGQQFDRFLQGDGTKADVLFVVSNTNTMAPYQQRLAEAIPGLMDAARQQGVDLHVGVTTTGLAASGRSGCIGGVAGGEAGRLVPADGSGPRIVTLDMPNAAQILQENAQPGTCAPLEQGLESMRLALSPPLSDHADDPRTALRSDGNLGFLRGEARLAVVVLADEDDHSGYDPEVYVQFLRALKGLDAAQRSSLYAIVPRGACATAGPPGSRFTSVAQATGGEVYEVCEGDYTAFLARLAQRGIGAQSVFPLSGVPDGSGLTVLLNGQPASGADWYLDTVHNAVVFNAGHVPPPGTQIEVDYRSACP